MSSILCLAMQPPQQTRHSYWHHQSFSTVLLNLQCSSPNFSVTTKSAHSLIPFESNYRSTQSASVSRVWIWVCSVKPRHQMHKIWPINYWTKDDSDKKSVVFTLITRRHKHRNQALTHTPLNSLQRKEKKMLSVVISPQCVTRKHYITYSIRCHFCIYELQNLQRSVEGCETAACLHIKASFSNTDVAKLLFKPSNTYIHT